MQHDEVFGALLDTAIPWADKLRQIRGVELDPLHRCPVQVRRRRPHSVRQQVVDGYQRRNAPGDARHSLTCAGATIRRPPSNSVHLAPSPDSIRGGLFERVHN